MNKHLLKQTISYLNEFSLGPAENMIDNTCTELVKQDQSITKQDVLEAIDFLEDIKALEWLDNTLLDMFPCTVVFARSNPNSNIEALSAFEMALRSKKDINDSIIKKLLHSTKLYIDGKINTELEEYAKRIEKEANLDIITETLNILYTQSIVLRKSNAEYRNQDRKTIDFSNKDFIYEMLPLKGIPVSRDATKDLQTFFKDTQMHEFDHSCPVCHARMPHMLVASHIKPFRDCAHIYETTTHDNGLLLCRNHDFLFDQGYISFDENGYTLVSNALKQKDPELSHFNLCDKIDDIYLTENRKKFLAYHREHIFQK